MQIRDLLWIGVAILTGPACVTHAPEVVGVSPPHASPPSDGGVGNDAEPPGGRIASDFREHMTPLGERFLSRGHGELFDARVWANAPALEAPDEDGGVKDTSLLIEELFSRDAVGGRAAGLFIMEKRGGAWTFDALDPAGKAAPSSRVASCAECHREGKDYVFPMAKSAVAKDGTQSRQ